MKRQKKSSKVFTSENKELETLLKDVSIPKIFTPNDIVEATVIFSDDNQMILDVGARAEGIVTGKELRLDGKKVVKKVGEKLMVFVIKAENKQGQVELSVRKTGDEIKWHELSDAKETNKPIKVKVIEANTGGVIVEIGGGLRGFVPSSQLKNSRIYTEVEYQTKEDASKQVQSKLAQMIDEELEVVVMEIDRDKNRVILSEKWVYSEGDLEKRNETLTGLKVGDVLTGKVTGIAPFGLFVNAAGLEGLVHLSEISWDKVTNPSDFFSVGNDVQVQVIGLNDNGKRVAYSIKRLKNDPWRDIVQKYKVGETVEGTISNIAYYGAFVKVEDGLNGLIHISELSHKLVKNPKDIVKEGQPVKVMIISISNEDRHLGLSLKRLQKPEKKSKKEGVEGEESTSSDSDSATEMQGLDALIKEEE